MVEIFINNLFCDIQSNISVIIILCSVFILYGKYTSNNDLAAYLTDGTKNFNWVLFY